MHALFSRIGPANEFKKQRMCYRAYTKILAKTQIKQEATISQMCLWKRWFWIFVKPLKWALQNKGSAYLLAQD